MEIEIFSKVNVETNSIYRIKTTLGFLAGIWRGQETPKAGETFNIEMTINEYSVIAEEGLKEIEVNLDTEKLVNRIQCLVEGVDDDGVGYLRLTPDCLIMVEGLKAEWKKKIIRILAKCDKVEFYPY